ncbi:MAG: phospholipase D family protein [Herminiimonas sp.]|nr:phospholipase D family protein [Herminiimonas sp.]
MQRIKGMLAQFSRAATGLLFAGIIGGCASLPREVIRPATFAVPLGDVQAGPLAVVTAASRPPGDLSGFRLLPTGAYAFNTRVAMARRARYSLDVQYYIVHDDETGRALLGELQNAARRGVRVRLLIDDIATQTLDQTLLRLAAQPNIEVRLFNPFAWGRSSFAIRLLSSLGDLRRINHRMHNKSFIADNVMAVTGGRNLGNEYFMYSNGSNFIDLDIFAAGRAAVDLSSVFDRYWNSEYAFPIASLVQYDQAMAEKAAQMMAARPGMPEMIGEDGLAPSVMRDVLGHAPLAQEIDAGKMNLTWAEARVVADDPSKVAGVTDATVGDTASGMLISLMGAAQSDVVVVSPYFVPGKPGMKLIRALHDRGVHMSVLTNSLAATDTPIVHIGYAAYRLEMLRLGVNLYELSPTRGSKDAKPGLFGSSRAKLHAKTVVVDREQLFVGSINLDARSARENTEQGLIIQSKALAGEVLQLLANDKGESSFHLRLTPDRAHIEWVGLDQGVETVYDDEPDAGFLLKFGLRVLGPIAPEELL